MFKTIIGIEIHAQLQTASKAFCRCANDTQSAANSNVCPICTGQPGTLPSLNKKMITYAIKAGLAFGCSIRKRTSFDRKNYFSSDMPKGYQITQFFQPIAEKGFVEILSETRKKIITVSSIHMEEDSARTLLKKDHQTGRFLKLLDFNRSGIPLLEIVTAPEITSPKEAVECFETIRNILMYLDVCDGIMESGSIRCDVNISIQNSKTGQSTNRVEIKNLNTYKNIERALLYEEKLLKDGFDSFIDNEAFTKDWDEQTKQTLISREKESLKDYRYFKEPDLSPVNIPDKLIESLKNHIPELPLKRLERMMNEYNLRYDIAKALVIDRPLADFFEQSMVILNTDEMKNIIIRDVKSYLNQQGKQLSETHLTPEKLYQLLNNIKTGRIPPLMKQTVLKALFETSKKVNTIIEEKNLIKIDDRQSLETILEEIITDNEEQFEAYRCGKKELFKWFIGQMIKRTKGRSDPKLIISVIEDKMGGLT